MNSNNNRSDLTGIQINTELPITFTMKWINQRKYLINKKYSNSQLKLSSVLPSASYHRILGYFNFINSLHSYHVIYYYAIHVIHKFIIHYIIKKKYIKDKKDEQEK